MKLLLTILGAVGIICGIFILLAVTIFAVGFIVSLTVSLVEEFFPKKESKKSEDKQVKEAENKDGDSYV